MTTPRLIDGERLLAWLRSEPQLAPAAFYIARGDFDAQPPAAERRVVEAARKLADRLDYERGNAVDPFDEISAALDELNAALRALESAAGKENA